MAKELRPKPEACDVVAFLVQTCYLMGRILEIENLEGDTKATIYEFDPEEERKICPKEECRALISFPVSRWPLKGTYEADGIGLVGAFSSPEYCAEKLTMSTWTLAAAVSMAFGYPLDTPSLEFIDAKGNLVTADFSVFETPVSVQFVRGRPLTDGAIVKRAEEIRGAVATGKLPTVLGEDGERYVKPLDFLRAWKNEGFPMAVPLKEALRTCCPAVLKEGAGGKRGRPRATAEEAKLAKKIYVARQQGTTYSEIEDLLAAELKAVIQTKPAKGKTYKPTPEEISKEVIRLAELWRAREKRRR